MWHYFEFPTRADAERFCRDVSECYRLGLAGIKSWDEPKRWRAGVYGMAVFIQEKP